MTPQLLTNFLWGLSGEPQQMLVKEGRVIARGASISAPQDVPRHDLEGKWMLPRFVEAHCHILPTGLDLLKLHLGRAETQADVLDLVRQQHQDQPEGWLHAVHYDQNRYEGGHLARLQLDQISPNRPILLRHVNGHASVANSAALQAAGVDDLTPDPVGGTYVRDDSGTLSGVLLEAAHEYVSGAAPRPDKTEMVEAILRAGRLMYSQGIGCATDMMTGFYDLEDELESYQLAAQAGCPIHLRLFVQWAEVFGPRASEGALERVKSLSTGNATGEGLRSVRMSGVKIFADGAIGSGTAAIYGKYIGDRKSATRPRRDDPQETDGQLIYRTERLNQMVRQADEAEFAIAVHSIGDYSTDLVMDAFEQTSDPARHRIEHAMILSDAQIERMAGLGLHCCTQPEFLVRFGHAYRGQLGPERASRLIRSRSLLDAGVPLSFSSDRPIVAGNPWDGMIAASRRPEGFAQEENCSRQEAIIAYTSGGSTANREPGQMGDLNPGSLAEYQLYAKSPIEDPGLPVPLN